MKSRALLVVALCVVVMALTFSPAKALEKKLDIGSRAPSLEIEHWVQDGNGFFKPVKEFKSGNVYVVEFWATWCAPCVMSMPHLAELQNKYRGENVQIISVSDESLDEVKALLSQKNEEIGKTFEEITSAYSLTTDPDRSVHTAYMDAAGENGIPTSFIVGKSGQIEWIGHPMELDEPLSKVVDESWDREAYKAERAAQQDFQESMQNMAMLAGAGKIDEAIELIEKEMSSPSQQPMIDEWKSVLNGLKLTTGSIDDDVLAYYRGAIEERRGEPWEMARFGYSMYEAIQRGGSIGPLADDTIKAIRGELKNAEEDIVPALYNAMALVQDGSGDTEAAVKSQQQSVNTAPEGRQKDRMQELLDELIKKAADGEGSEE